jgi:predicted DCC family thiol-disulfide oxidoreductase YuxK
VTASSSTRPGDDWVPPDPDSPAVPKGWVLYDAACGFCSWWIPYWRSHIRRAGFEVASLQSGFARRHTGRIGSDVNRDILLLLRDGTLVAGADAYIYGMRQVWWSRPLGYVFGLPGLRHLTWVFYRWFNRNRFFVSKICGLPPERGGGA